MEQDDGIVIDVDNARVRRGRKHDLVRIVSGRDPGADVEKLPDPGLGGQESGRPGEERPVGPHRLHDPGIGRHDRVTGRTVGREIVLASEPVIVHAGAVRHAGVNTGLAAVAVATAGVHEANIPGHTGFAAAAGQGLGFGGRLTGCGL